MKDVRQALPKGRTTELIIKRLEKEILVYDRRCDQAHCLNSPAALVWAHCDGRTTIAEMTQLLEAEMQAPIRPELVWLALEQLDKSRLLEGPLPATSDAEKPTRRGLVTRLGVAMAVTVPLISSITAPTVAQAASCLPTGATCTGNAQCCSNNCVDNGRGVFECT